MRRSRSPDPLYPPDPLYHNRQVRKITKSKGGFSNDDALYKLVFLIYQDISKKWDKSISNWAEIISQLSIHFEERLEGKVR